MTREKLAILFGILVPIIWASTAVVGVTTGNYIMFELTLPVVLAEAGWLFGVQVALSKKNGKHGS